MHVLQHIYFILFIQILGQTRHGGKRLDPISSIYKKPRWRSRPHGWQFQGLQLTEFDGTLRILFSLEPEKTSPQASCVIWLPGWNYPYSLLTVTFGSFGQGQRGIHLFKINPGEMATNRNIAFDGLHPPSPIYVNNQIYKFHPLNYNIYIYIYVPCSGRQM